MAAPDFFLKPGFRFGRQPKSFERQIMKTKRIRSWLLEITLTLFLLAHAARAQSPPSWAIIANTVGFMVFHRSLQLDRW